MKNTAGSLDNCLVVFALKAESGGRFDAFNTVYCGVGKVNAAYRLTQALMQWKHERGRAPHLVLNLGSAGSPHFRTGEVVNCTGFIQRDFDVSAFGHDLYVNPFDNLPGLLKTGQRWNAHPEGVCGTGDSFVADASQPTPWNVMDMEAYALARVCAAEEIPFGCLKYITDGADGEAATVWEQRLATAALALEGAVSELKV